MGATSINFIIKYNEPYHQGDIRDGATVAEQFGLGNKGYQDFVVEDHELLCYSSGWLEDNLLAIGAAHLLQPERLARPDNTKRTYTT